MAGTGYQLREAKTLFFKFVLEEMYELGHIIKSRCLDTNFRALTANADIFQREIYTKARAKDVSSETIITTVGYAAYSIFTATYFVKVCLLKKTDNYF